MGLIMTSQLNQQHGDSGILRTSETGMTFLSHSVIPILDKRSDGQTPESFASLSEVVSKNMELPSQA